MASYVNGHIVHPAMNPDECVACATTFEYEIAVNDVKLCMVPAMTDGGFFIIQGAKKVLMIQETRLKSEPFVTLAPPCCELFVQNAVVPVRIQIVDDSVIELDTKMIHKDLRDIPSIGLFEVLMYMFLSHMKNTTEKFEHIVYLLQSYCTQQDYADICLTYVIASSTGIGGLSILEDKEIIRAKLLGGMSDTNVVATLVQMVALCVGAKFGITKPSDRDDYAIKCLRTPGNIVYSLFKQCIHPEQKNLQNAINRKIYSCIRRGELKVAGRVQAKLAVQLSDRSDIDVLSSVRKVVVPCDPNSSNMQMRQIHRTQRGYICPCETPEGKTVGLNKSLACSCLISVETDVSDWIRTHCRQEPFQGSVWVIVDGAVVGWTAKASQDVLDLKRAYPTASFVLLDNVLKVRTCGGRPLQPLLVVPFDWNDVGKPSANEKETNAIPRLLSNGLLHYVDPFERAHNKVASLDYQCDLESFRYMELDPSMMLGLAASMIPFPEHNQSARNVFASSMVKQAMQMKGSGTTCNYLQKPIVYTNVSRAVGYDDNPNGMNLVTCIMSLEGYNQEDAILFKKSCVDRGLFDSIVRSSTSTVVSNPWHLVKIDGKLFVLSGGTEKSLLEIAPMLSQPKVVDTKEVLLDSGKSHISVTIEEHRHLSPGDKFASRHAQKGVVGRIMNEADMPFTEQGITPDIIINPHAIPSRMTVGQLIESVLGKAGCITGDFVDGTPFLGRDIHDILKTKDTETMMLGTTGELIETPIAIGVVYYMALKHQAADKVYVRSSGTKSLMSRQPISGRSKGGGLRFGEMEYDTLIAHGAYKIITKISEHSDMIDVPYCTECSLVTDSKKCPSCDSDTVVKMMPFSYVVFKDLMLSANVLVQTTL